MRKCLGSLFLALLPLSLYAFDLSLGLRAGSPLTVLYGEDYEAKKQPEKAYWDSYFFSDLPVTDNITPGLHASLFCTIGVFDFLSIQPEVAFTYVKPGYSLNFEKSGYYPAEIKIEYDYALLELPLLLKARFTLGRKKAFRLNIYTGPELMINLITPKKTYTADATGEETYNPDYYKRGAWSLIFGLEMEHTIFLSRSGYNLAATHPSSPFYICTDIRYNLNLTSFDNFPVPALNDTRMHMFFISVGAGWKLIGR